MRLFFFLIALLLLPVRGFGQTVFFRADGESGTVVPPWNRNDNVDATISKSIVHSGNRSYRFHLPSPCNTCGQNNNQSFVVRQQNIVNGYYSYWGYIDEGLNDKTGIQFQFKADISSAGTGAGPKMNLGIENKGFGRRFYLSIADCGTTGEEIIVGVKGHHNNDNCKWMQANDTALAVPFRTWYHIEAYLKATETNGEVKVWQNGRLIFHVAHARLNTLTIPSKDAFREFLQWHVGLYQSNSTTPQTIYVDDAVIADHQIFRAQTLSSPASPSNLTLQMGN